MLLNSLQLEATRIQGSYPNSYKEFPKPTELLTIDKMALLIVIEAYNSGYLNTIGLSLHKYLEFNELIPSIEKDAGI
jgi:hypothetical protein